MSQKYYEQDGQDARVHSSGGEIDFDLYEGGLRCGFYDEWILATRGHYRRTHHKQSSTYESHGDKQNE